INNSTVEVFVSQRGSNSNETLSEAQVFIGPVPLISSQVDPNNPTHNTVDWSANLNIPAPFNAVQTPTLFITTTVTTGDGSTSPLSYGFVAQFVTPPTTPQPTSTPTPSGCVLSVSPNPIDINGSTVGTAVTQDVTLQNTGTETIDVSNIAISGTNAADFSFKIATSPSATPTAFAAFTLAAPVGSTAGGSETVVVTWTPSVTTGESANLVITDTCGTSTIPISGTVTQPKIEVIPTSLLFGNVTVGQTGVQQLTIINFGAGTLNITALTFGLGASSPFSIPPPSPLPLNVASDSLTSITVEFSPTAAGTITDTLTIASNDPTHPSLGVPLTGTGVSSLAPAPTVIVTSPTAGQLVGSGTTFTVSFSVGDTATPATPTYTVNLSVNGGGFTPVAGGNAVVGSNSVGVAAPAVTTTDAIIQVVVSDVRTTGPGTGLSGAFTIGTPPVISMVKYSNTGKIKLSGTGISSGALLIITSTGETFPLTFNGAVWVVKPDVQGSKGDLMDQVASPGSTIQVQVESGGLTSAAVSVTRG
ncbi:MAG TPA: choice-of-anchor D domain-containing protein, partial [Blastocatellia bacterium]